jgi:hypothetical protein
MGGPLDSFINCRLYCLHPFGGNAMQWSHTHLVPHLSGALILLSREKHNTYTLRVSTTKMKYRNICYTYVTKVMVYLSSELCSWDPVTCTMRLTHAHTHTRESWLVVLQSYWSIRGTVCNTTCMGHPSSHLFIVSNSASCFDFSWFITYRNTCCVRDWFDNEPLLNRTACAHTHM